MRFHLRITRLAGLTAGVLLTTTLVASGPPQAPAGASERPAFSFAEPGISPDGREIAFVSGGDVWTVPTAGGEARLLVADPETESRPLYSPDGRELAFVSERTGSGDIYILRFETGTLRRVTWDDGREQLDGWSRDGRWIYFSSTSRDIAGMNDVYRVPAGGGTPMPVSEDRYVNEFGAAPSPDGRQLVVVARGNASGQWWRNGSSHLDKSELWLRQIDADGLEAYTQLTPRDAKQEWPMWDADGRNLYYVADRGGAENLWSRPASPVGRDRKLTDFRAGRVLWPSITADGKTIAFERDFGIWTLETATGQARPVSVTRRGAPSMPTPERLRLTSQFSDLALAPDGRKVAFVARGEVFAASARDGGEATRVTSTLALESQPAWSADSRKLVYGSARDGGEQLYMYDFTTSTETALTTGTGTDVSPVFSPDGRSLAFLRDRRELRVIDLESKTERLLSTGTFGDSRDRPALAWSPDGQWIALFAVGRKMFKNVELVPAAGGTRQPVSYLANTFADALDWSPDGTYLVFNTRQRTEQAELARVDLVLRTPRFREDLFRDLFNEPTPRDRRIADPANPVARETASPAPREPAKVEPVFPNIRERLSFLPVGLDVNDVIISPDGKTALVVASSGGPANLYTWPLDELASGPAVARQITTSTGAKSDPQFTADGREVYYLEGGRIQIATLERRESRPLSVTAELVVDFADDRLTVFDEAWTLMRDNFYDPAFHGVDWSESRAVYRPRAAAATTRDELRRVISLMVGDLNASHLGVSGGGGGGGGAGGAAVGRLGLRFDRREYEAAGRFRVTAIVPLGPAALAGDIAVGDLLVAVNGRAVGAGVNLNEQLAGASGRKVTLAVARQPGGPTRDVVVQPTSQGTEKGLLYRQWVSANREYVLKASGGRLGYVHMVNMSEGALDQLFIDLDAENHLLDGVVVDLRNNSGGFVNAYALDVFARRPYLRMSVRGLPEAPARSVLGQRSLEAPTVLVTNQHSLSDAEDFTEGYRTLKLGSVVGEPTAGWIIYTWNARLVDGTSFRLPRMRVLGADGKNMELVPRPVDVEVTRPLGETTTGKDSQLDEAIRVLLAQIGRAQ
jgi:Tol biopolymer transport system component/C-terminal processing protease CtpA/Prc